MVYGRAERRLIVLGTTAIAILLVWIAAPSVALAASLGGPHSALTSSPIGCPVCHLFLGGPAPDYACIRCHVRPGGEGRTVYNGDEANYRTEDGFGHNTPETVGCLDCHSAHGPNFSSPALSGMMLKELSYQHRALEAVDLGTATHDVALSVWCTGCHAQWPEIYVRGDSVIHPFAPANPGVAWNDCTSCLSCHAALGGFPHYTLGADAGLVGAPRADGKREGASDRSLDGVCLGCHRGGGLDGLQGVGISY